MSYLKSNQIASLEQRLKLREDEIGKLKSARVREQALPQDAIQARRQLLIADGRRLIADYNAQQSEQRLIVFLNAHKEWHALRAQFDPNKLHDLESDRILVATRGDVKDGKVYYLQREIDRLEREWGLA